MNAALTHAPQPGLHPGPQSRGLRQSARTVLALRRVDHWLRQTPLITSTFISKLALPPFGAAGLSVAIPVMAAASALGAATGRLVLHPQRLLAYAVVISVLVGLQLALETAFSPASLLLLVVLHLPYVFALRRAADPAQVLESFQTVALAIAALGALQYVVQFFIGPAYAFPVENFFPADFRVSAFNMQGSLEYESEVYRTNGVFMLEPSFFSQLMAIGVVVELITRRRLWALLLFVVAMLLSYSGTGIAQLVISLLFLAAVQRRWKLLGGLFGGLLAAGLALGAAASLVADLPYVSVFVKRATEFSAQGSSGFARFVGGFYMFEQFLWTDPLRALAGYGAGSFQRYSLRANYPAAGMAIFKMVFEFGLVGAGIYFAFLFGCIARAGGPSVLRFAVALSFLLNGNYIPFAHGLALTLLIWPSRAKT